MTCELLPARPEMPGLGERAQVLVTGQQVSLMIATGNRVGAPHDEAIEEDEGKDPDDELLQP